MTFQGVLAQVTTHFPESIPPSQPGRAFFPRPWGLGPLTLCCTDLRIPYMTYESKRVLRFSQSGIQRDRRR